MTIRIDSHNRRSHGARMLAHETGILRTTPEHISLSSSFDTIINWGCSNRRFPHAEYINNPEAVAVASNKLQTAQALGRAGVNQPPYTTSREVAQSWLGESKSILARTLLRGSCGRGITYYGGSRDNGHSGEIRPAPLYTQYIKKRDEYRLHVFSPITGATPAHGTSPALISPLASGRDSTRRLERDRDGIDGGEATDGRERTRRIIDIQQKRTRAGVPRDEINYQIRNSDKGWVYCREDVDCPQSLRQLAIDAVSALGLDFGAVDIGWNSHQETGTVYEVNTAPGLEGSTIGLYARAFIDRLPILQGGAYLRRRQRRR